MTKETDRVNETHLGFIESVIDRMNRNSFQAKAWCVTIMAALLAFCLTCGRAAPYFIALGLYLLVVVIFGVLDVYYLYLELRYRDLYKAVAHLDGNPPEDYQMDLGKLTGRERRGYIRKAIKSKSVWPLYSALAALHIVLGCLFCVL
ncbi:MAG: hypothetical protein LUD72_09510 [Bacteroidales bacterium]|nr:hypothetical protein [Bacteroidales bacterium]